MNTLTLILKRWLSSKTTLVLWLLSLLLVLAFCWQLYRQANPPVSFALAVVDQDHSAQARAYIASLEAHPLLSITELDSQEAHKRFRRGQMVAVLTLPKDFFNRVKNAKLELSYRHYDGVAPALTDILAQGLMASIGRSHLADAAARYLSPDWVGPALGYYEKYLEDHPTTFDARIRTVRSQKGLLGDVQQQVIYTANQGLGYGLVLLLLLLTRHQSYEAAKESYATQRLRLIPGQHQKFQLCQELFDLAVVAIPWSTLALYVSWTLGLRLWLAVGLWCYGLIVLWLFRWVMGSLYGLFYKGSWHRSGESEPLALLMVALIVAPSLLGGALVPLDLLPAQMNAFLFWNPFFAFNHGFYQLVGTGGLSPYFLVVRALALGRWIGKYFLILSKIGIKIKWVTRQ